MDRLLIVGFGNVLRSDDGLGWRVADALARQNTRKDVRIVTTQQLMPEMAELASRAEQILFIDAARDGQPGNVACEELVPTESPVRHSHELSPAAVLRLAKDLYGRCPPAELFTITGESFETGDTMSAPVVAAIPGLMAKIKEIIDSAQEQE